MTYIYASPPVMTYFSQSEWSKLHVGDFITINQHHEELVHAGKVFERSDLRVRGIIGTVISTTDTDYSLQVWDEKDFFFQRMSLFF